MTSDKRIEMDPSSAEAIRDLAEGIREDNAKALGFTQTDLVNYYRRRVALGVHQLLVVVNKVVEEDTLEPNVK